MPEQKHLIKRQIIEIQTPRQADAQAMQATISRIYRQQLVPVIDQLCSEVSGPEVRHRIDRLEVDVGVIAADRLETDLVTKVGEELRRVLTAQITAQATVRAPAQPPVAAHTQVELFAHFVRTGNLPWWADARQPQLLAACLDELLHQAPAALLPLLPTLVRTPRQRRRLILHVADAHLTALLGLLTPAYQTALATDLPVWLDLLTASAVAAGHEPTALRLPFWDALFEVAGLGGASYPTLAAFYQAVLRRSATAHGVAYGALLADLQACATATPAQVSAAVQHMIASLVRTAPAAADQAPLAQTLAQLQAAGGALTELWRLLQRLLPDLPPAAQAALQRALPTPVAARAVDAALMQARLHQPLHPLLADPHLPAALRTELRQWLRAPTATVGSPVQAPPDDLAFDAGDDLYLANAGLVILWPFLRAFFAHLDLLAGDTFKNAAAQQRAVGLLQALVSTENADDTVWPEYQVPLNKLLCGLAVDALFDFGPPLTAAELADALDLLNAVIAQAPILNGMTPDGFRATFLQRAGVLRVQAGVWLLQVEQATYDIVLDRFPWRWDWVKLPWMDAPLRVAWGE